MAMDDNDVIKIVFQERYRYIKRHGDDYLNSFDDSIVSDLMNTALLLKLDEEVDNIMERGHSYAKEIWKRMVWDRAWTLEDLSWKI